MKKILSNTIKCLCIATLAFYAAEGFRSKHETNASKTPILNILKKYHLFEPEKDYKIKLNFEENTSKYMKVTNTVRAELEEIIAKSKELKNKKKEIIPNLPQKLKKEKTFDPLVYNKNHAIAYIGKINIKKSNRIDRYDYKVESLPFTLFHYKNDETKLPDSYYVTYVYEEDNAWYFIPKTGITFKEIKWRRYKKTDFYTFSGALDYGTLRVRADKSKSQTMKYKLPVPLKLIFLHPNDKYFANGHLGANFESDLDKKFPNGWITSEPVFFKPVIKNGWQTLEVLRHDYDPLYRKHKKEKNNEF